MSIGSKHYFCRARVWCVLQWMVFHFDEYQGLCDVVFIVCRFLLAPAKIHDDHILGTSVMTNNAFRAVDMSPRERQRKVGEVALYGGRHTVPGPYARAIYYHLDQIYQRYMSHVFSITCSIHTCMMSGTSTPQSASYILEHKVSTQNIPNPPGQASHTIEAASGTRRRPREPLATLL